MLAWGRVWERALVRVWGPALVRVWERALVLVSERGLGPVLVLVLARALEQAWVQPLA